MKVRVVVILAVVGMVAWWSWQRFLVHDPVPTDAVVVQLAEEDWGPGYCYDHETQWPCLIPTDIELDRSKADYSSHDHGESYRRCFNISLQIETTHWDYSYGGPSEPRTYMAGAKPVHACADVSYFTGAADNPGSWDFVPTDDPPWYRDTLDALHAILCANPPANSAYTCA